MQEQPGEVLRGSGELHGNRVWLPIGQGTIRAGRVMPSRGSAARVREPRRDGVVGAEDSRQHGGRLVS